MKRKRFISQLFLSGLASVSMASIMKPENSDKDESASKMKRQVGFNHLPNKEKKTMKTVLHKSNTRGHANHGWLNSHHSFSFANYYNPERTNFGMLRVLNDDTVAPGMGFGTHPHKNMEIISIPLEGDLEHKDSMGTSAVIKEGDVQVMSAGTGVHHSESNKNKDKEVKFLQIWVIPKKENVSPRYDQLAISDLQRPNTFSQILSPSPDDQGVWINQDAWFSIGDFNEPTENMYQINRSGNGVYAFVLNGQVTINDQALEARDGFGVWDTDQLKVKAEKGARILLMEVPMAS